MKSIGSLRDRPLKSICVMEICKTWDGRDQYMVVLVSRPNTEGVMQRSWKLVAGVPDTSQALDISHWVLGTVQSAMASFSGIQGVLEE